MKYYPEFETLLLEQEAGATTLLLKLLNILTRYFSDHPDLTPAEQRQKLLFFYEKVTEAHPLMAIFPNLYHFLTAETDKESMDIPALILEFRERVNVNINQTVESASRIIRDDFRLFTFSHSSIVRKTIISALRDGKKFSVATTECRPVHEAVNLAKFLARYDVPVSLYTDAAVERALSECDAVFVGTDWYWENGFVNKIGTHLVLRICRERGIPFYVLSDSSKWMPEPPKDWSKDRHPSSLILTESINNISVFNPYFESVPFTGVTGMIVNGEVKKFE